MGAALMAQVTMKWAYIGNDAYRVLTRMAVVAHDRESASAPARRYFGGHEALMDVLGRGSHTRKTRLRRVSEAIAELIQVGAVVCEQGGHNGRNAVYELTLDAAPIEAKPKRVRSTAFTDQDAHVSRTKGRARVAPSGRARVAPSYKQEEELLEESQEERLEDVRARSSDPPALHVIAGAAQTTSRFIQPSIWPASVPSPRAPAEPVRSLTPGEQARIDVRRLLQDRKRGRTSA